MENPERSVEYYKNTLQLLRGEGNPQIAWDILTEMGSCYPRMHFFILNETSFASDPNYREGVTHAYCIFAGDNSGFKNNKILPKDNATDWLQRNFRNYVEFLRRQETRDFMDGAIDLIGFLFDTEIRPALF